jgi:lipopolysaccharide/colanic/teichoic acid biosynthesis glycosyltransferase
MEDGRVYRRFFKRLLDIILSLLGLIVLSPVLFGAWVAVFFALGWPVFFRQDRPGKDGRIFRILKFRTMRVAKAGEDALASDGVRLTQLGSVLRKASIDELPELWNVLVGEMSLVGPRPLLVEYLPLYSAEQARRHEVRPGITGWAQVNGRNAVDWTERFRMDVWYVDHCSFWLDVKILVMTVASVFKREGISAAGHATMPPFGREEN